MIGDEGSTCPRRDCERVDDGRKTWASYDLCIIDPKKNYWAGREDTRTKEFWFFEPVEGGPTDGGAEKRHGHVPRAVCRFISKTTFKTSSSSSQRSHVLPAERLGLFFCFCPLCDRIYILCKFTVRLFKFFVPLYTGNCSETTLRSRLKSRLITIPARTTTNCLFTVQY